MILGQIKTDVLRMHCNDKKLYSEQIPDPHLVLHMRPEHGGVRHRRPTEEGVRGWLSTQVSA